jgi:hypothetical protein
MCSNKNYIKLLISGLLAWYFIEYALGEKTEFKWNILDGVNLLIHEAGHTIFMFFGEFIHVLGGSFFQVFVPAVFVFYFLYFRREYYSGSLLLFWLGQSVLNLSVYVGDSIRQELPLLGGDNSIHDWNYILSKLGLLRQTYHIATGFYDIGFFIIITAIVLSCYFAWYGELYIKKDK